MLYSKIETEIETLNFISISEERKIILQPLIDYIQSKTKTNQAINLNFICTHNSRRSHLSQVWAQTMATYFNISSVNCYSGGTEATALFPSVAEALGGSGFKLKKLSQESNPVYAIKYSDIHHPVIGFSKTFDDSFNPNTNFAAIMTCSSADKGCPLIAGTNVRTYYIRRP
jgi:arsenate reductase